MQDKDREKNPLISDITANKIFTIHENTNNEKKIREPSNERTYKQDCEKIPHMQIPKKNAFSTLCGRKFSLSNIKNMRNDDLFTIKKLNDPFTENKFSNKFSQKNYKDHIYMGIFFLL